MLCLQEYHEILDLIQWNILATDLVTHLKHMSDIEAMAEEGYSPTNPYHHKLLSSLLMTACDLNNSCKDWESALAVSVRYRERERRGGEGLEGERK